MCGGCDQALLTTGNQPECLVWGSNEPAQLDVGERKLSAGKRIKVGDATRIRRCVDYIDRVELAGNRNQDGAVATELHAVGICLLVVTLEVFRLERAWLSQTKGLGLSLG